MKHILSVLSSVSVLMAASAASAQYTTDTDCGAAGYACLNGRHCSSQRCSPAWQAMSTVSAPNGSIGGAAEALGGRIAVFGGCDGNAQQVTSAGSYNPANDTWSSMASPNTARQYAATAAGNGGVYVFGGVTSCDTPNTSVNTLEYIGSPGGSFSSLSPANPPAARYAAAMTWTGLELYVYGGSDGSNVALASGSHRVAGGGWGANNCALTGCERGGNYDLWTVELGGLLGLGVRSWGGITGYGDAPQALTFGVLLGTWSKAWSTPSGGPDFQNELCSASRGGDGDGTRRIYYIGWSGSTNGVWIYDRTSSSWSFDGSWISGLSVCASSAWYGGELFSFSGDSGQFGGRYQPPAP